VPAGADAYILRWIIHDWSEAEAVALLGKVREAMKPGARLLLLEELIPETPELMSRQVADDLAALLRKHVAGVTVWRD
jgi:hypothetical protein